MPKTPEYERKTFQCVEEKRCATLLLEWREEGGKRILVGVECDNPRIRGLEPYVCRWSCWDKLEPAAARKAGAKPVKKAAPKKAAKKAAPAKSKTTAPKTRRSR